MEPPSPLISGVNAFPSRFVNRSIFICDALESHECACCLLFDVRQNYCQSFLYFHRLSLLSTRETFSRNRSIQFINLLGKGLIPRACMGDGGSN